MISSKLFKKKRGGTIGVIIPKIDSAFLSSVISGMERYASENSFRLIIMQSHESGTRELDCLKTLQKAGVDGIMISLASNSKNMDHLLRLHNKGFPVTLFDRIIENPLIPYIEIDNKQASFEVTQHLISIGCKSIVHITGNLERNVYIDRLMGYKEALLFNQLEFDPRLVFVSELGLEAGERIARLILEMKKKPDAIYAMNDITAVSCMSMLKKNGIKVPSQMAIAGFNNDPVSRLVEPNLTTVNYPGFKMGLGAAQIMVNQLRGMTAKHIHKDNILRTDLIIRDSSNKDGQFGDSSDY